MQWAAALSSGIGSMIAAPHGVALSHRMPRAVLQRCFGVMMMLAACSTLMRL